MQSEMFTGLNLGSKGLWRSKAIKTTSVRHVARTGTGTGTVRRGWARQEYLQGTRVTALRAQCS